MSSPNGLKIPLLETNPDVPGTKEQYGEEHKKDCEHDKEEKWEEAAIYVQEGEDNDNLLSHPTGKWSKLAYKTLHHPVFYVFDLLLCIMLMLLALIESPSVLFGIPDDNKSVIKIHGVLECTILFLFVVIFILRLLWQKSNFFTHFRSLFLAFILVVMITESLTVLGRQQSHIRVTRALRPVFFLDTYLMSQIRRALRHILHSLKRILDIIVHLLFIIALFSIIAYYLFAEIDPDYFQTLQLSYVGLFITFTTANNPDVMMEAYSKENASPLFFITYIVITVYFITNILLAVVYSNFSEEEKKKFRELFLHKRKALHSAFDVLAGKNGIKFCDFVLFMQHYKPRIPEWQVMCIFRALKEGGGQVQNTAREQNQDTACEQEQGTRHLMQTAPMERTHTPSKDRKQEEDQLHLEEFYTFCEVQNLRWTKIKEKTRNKIYHVVRWKWFNSIIHVVILLNTLFLFLCVLYIPSLKAPEQVRIAIPIAFVFLLVYTLEGIIKIIALGWGYFTKFWNIFDFVLLSLSWIALCLEVKFHILIILRPIKLIRLVRLNKRYRDFSNTIIILIPQLISVGILLLLIYYFFAIIGMEFLEDKVHEGCCVNASFNVGKHFAAAHNETSVNDFYLMNFDNIYRSYVTLFSLMVVNDWFIIMEGFASEVEHGWLARVYFMAYFIVTLVVLQIAITFTVDVFVMQLEQSSNSDPTKRKDDPDTLEGHKKKKEVNITLLNEDIQKVQQCKTTCDEVQKCGTTCFTQNKQFRRRMELEDNSEHKFRGQRPRTKYDTYLWQLRSAIKTWTEQQDKEFEKEKAGKENTNTNSKKTFKEMAWNLTKKVLEEILEYIKKTILEYTEG